MLTTIEDIVSYDTAISLDEIDIMFLNSLNNPHQPDESDKIKLIREEFLKTFCEVLKKDITNEIDKEYIESRIEKLTFTYGGPFRFYERFLIARDGDVSKASSMMKEMLEVRLRVLGERLVSSLTESNDINNMGSDEAEQTLIKGIDKFWAIEIYGFTKSGYILLTGKLANIEPGEFIKKYSKKEIGQYYFHFVEKANLLQRISNSHPFSTNTGEESYKSKKMVEIYDFNHLSRKQFSMSGIKVLKDVLGLGQVVFPEQSERAYMINTPFFFSACWSIISRVLDKVTRDKTVISRYGCDKEITELLGSKDKLKTLMDRVLNKVNSH